MVRHHLHAAEPLQPIETSQAAIRRFHLAGDIGERCRPSVVSDPLAERGRVVVRLRTDEPPRRDLPKRRWEWNVVHRSVIDDLSVTSEGLRQSAAILEGQVQSDAFITKAS
jgi:hypothetical protein